MIKYLSYIIAAISIFIVSACCRNLDLTEHNEQHVVITVQMGGDSNTTRAYLQGKSTDATLIAKWNEDEKVRIYVQQQGTIYDAGEWAFFSISGDGKLGRVAFFLPSGINSDQPYELYGVSSQLTTSIIKDANGKDCLSCTYKSPKRFNYTPWTYSSIHIPYYFMGTGGGNKSVDVLAHHLVAYEFTHITNKTKEVFLINHKGYYAPKKWYYNKVNLTFPDCKVTGSNDGDIEASGKYEIDRDDTQAFIACYLPNGEKPQGLQMNIAIEKQTDIRSTNYCNSKIPMQVGHAYHLRGTWDGEKLSFTKDIEEEDFNFELEDMPGENLAEGDDVEEDSEYPYIKLTTDKAIGEEIQIDILPFYESDMSQEKDIWIDINNNKLKDAGEVLSQSYGNTIHYKGIVTSETFNIYGEVRTLHCNYGNLTHLYLSKKSHNLTVLELQYNNLRELIIPENSNIEEIYCQSNQLEKVIVKNNKVRVLELEYNNLSSMDFSNLGNLISLGVGYNKFKHLDVSGLPNLISLGCYNNELESLVLLYNSKLLFLSCRDNSHLGDINVSLFPNLKTLICVTCGMKELNLNNNTHIETLLCDDNYLKELDLRNNQQLKCIGIGYNSFDCDALNSIYNQLPDISAQESADIIWPFMFKMLRASGNPGYYQSEQTIAVNKGWEFGDKWIDNARNRRSLQNFYGSGNSKQK